MQQQADSIGGLMPQILKNEAQDEKGEMARLSSFVGAIAIGDLIKTTLGPKGMDKILQPLTAEGAGDKIVITNDGATILKSIYIDNPAAKILVDISKTQDSSVGDGTTTVAVLASELLREAEKLIHRKFHPQIIIEGWREATRVARETLVKIAIDNSKDKELFRKDLNNIAKTTLSSKLLTHEKEFFAKMVVDAVMRFHDVMPNLEYIHIIKKAGGSLKDSFLADGFILEKSISVSCPKMKKNAKILVANTQMDYDKIKIYGSKVKVDSIDKMAEIETAEKQKMKNKVDRILSHNIDVFINRQLIYNYPEQLLAEKGVMVIEHADFEGVERLSAVLGADILSTFETPEKIKLGFCELVEEIMIGEDKMISFKGCKRGEACTIVLRGASNHILDEAERSLHDALCVIVETVKSHNMVYGGGHTEMRMAYEVDKFAETIKGKVSTCMNSFAHALRQIPTIIADNAGFDSAELIANLKNEIYSGKPAAGLNMNDGTVGDMKELGIYECFRVKEQALLSACEAAEMILRVDEVVTCAPRKRERE